MNTCIYFLQFPSANYTLFYNLYFIYIIVFSTRKQTKDVSIQLQKLTTSVIKKPEMLTEEECVFRCSHKAVEVNRASSCPVWFICFAVCRWAVGAATAAFCLDDSTDITTRRPNSSSWVLLSVSKCFELKVAQKRKSRRTIQKKRLVTKCQGVKWCVWLG